MPMETGQFRRHPAGYGFITPTRPSDALREALGKQPPRKRDVWVPQGLVERADLPDGATVEFEWEVGRLMTPVATRMKAARKEELRVELPPDRAPVNPYNFAALVGEEPFERRGDRGEQVVPTHDRLHDRLLSGSIEIELVAVTPVFVPDGMQQASETVRTPWKCRRAGGEEAYGIPGSSMKGVLRTLFEAWTNGHLVGSDSPLAMGLCGFGADRTKLTIERADASEMAFGFAAAHESRNGTVASHPFRGRVQPTTFWASTGTQPVDPAVELGALTSPRSSTAGRRYYVRPAGEGEPVSSRPRGRKLFWHQQWEAGALAAGAHLWPQQTRRSRQAPPPMRPLPAGASFLGRIQFTNLEPWELGALIVSFAPSSFWQEGESWRREPRYGIKLGKAKPRGWGSLICRRLALRRRADAWAFQSLDAALLGDSEGITCYVADFQEWLRDVARIDDAGEIPFVRDLERLLRIPSREWVVSYPGPQPKGSPSVPMPLARDVEVP